MKPIHAAAAAIFALATTATAQTPAAPDDPEGTVVAELVVRAATPGPAWWKVSDADSTVWVLGLPAGYTPTKLAWDRSVLQKRLTGARSLMAPPMGSVSIQGSGWKAAGMVARMAPGVRWTNGNIEKDLPPALATRFAAVRTKLKKPASRYGTPLPALAGLKLTQDYLDWAALNGDVGDEAIAMAKKLKAPVVRPPTIAAAALKLDEVGLDAPGPAACFAAMLDDVEAAPEHYRTAASAWAARRPPGPGRPPRRVLDLRERHQDDRLLAQGHRRPDRRHRGGAEEARQGRGHRPAPPDGGR
jgi:hypothetical protein